MCAIETIKKAGLICDDVANYVLLDYLVGDKKHWTTQFNKCIEAIDFCCTADGTPNIYNCFCRRPFAVDKRIFIKDILRLDMLWFNKGLTRKLEHWVWERAHDYYEEESDIEFGEAMETFEDSNAYITEFRLAVFNNEFSSF